MDERFLNALKGMALACELGSAGQSETEWALLAAETIAASSGAADFNALARAYGQLTSSPESGVDDARGARALAQRQSELSGQLSRGNGVLARATVLAFAAPSDAEAVEWARKDATLTDFRLVSSWAAAAMAAALRAPRGEESARAFAQIEGDHPAEAALALSPEALLELCAGSDVGDLATQLAVALAVAAPADPEHPVAETFTTAIETIVGAKGIGSSHLAAAGALLGAIGGLDGLAEPPQSARIEAAVAALAR